MNLAPAVRCNAYEALMRGGGAPSRIPMRAHACSNQRLVREPVLEIKMAHFLVSDDRYRALIYDDDRRPHRADLGQSLGDYRFGRARGKSAHGPLHRIGGYFRNMVEAIANSKLRRMALELELRGIPTRDEN